MVVSITNSVRTNNGLTGGWKEIKCVQKKGDTSLPQYEEVQIDGENWDEEIEPSCSEKYCGPIPEIKNK